MLTVLLLSLVAQAPADAPSSAGSPRAASLMSRLELQEEIDALEEARPSKGRPLGLVAGGGAVIGGWGVYSYLASPDKAVVRTSPAQSCGQGNLICAGERPMHPAEFAVLAVGAAMILAGVVWYVVELIVYRGDSARVTELKQALDMLDRQTPKKDEERFPAPSSSRALPALPLAINVTLARF